MKTPIRHALSLGLLAAASTLSLSAQQPVPQPPPMPASAPAAVDANGNPVMPQLRTAEELDQLLSPIALYPDPLIAIMLPASTSATDIVLAAREIKQDPDLSQLDNEPWDESVKSLCHYPEVVTWMDANLTWTKQLGEAVRDQQPDVMNAIQRLRAKAKANGALTTTPQQQIVDEGGFIDIMPAQPDVIYVPEYEPEIVFADNPGWSYGYSPVWFGPPLFAGSWLAFDLSWRRHELWYENRRHWNDTHDWRHPVFPGQSGFVANADRRPWHPSAQPIRTPRTPAFAVAGPGGGGPAPAARNWRTAPVVRPGNRPSFEGGPGAPVVAAQNNTFRNQGQNQPSAQSRDRAEFRPGNPGTTAVTPVVPGRTNTPVPMPNTRPVSPPIPGSPAPNVAQYNNVRSAQQQQSDEARLQRQRDLEARRQYAAQMQEQQMERVGQQVAQQYYRQQQSVQPQQQVVRPQYPQNQPQQQAVQPRVYQNPGYRGVQTPTPAPRVQATPPPQPQPQQQQQAPERRGDDGRRERP